MSKEIPLFGNNQQKQQPPQAKINIKAEDLEDVTCDNCGSKVFREAIMFKKVSAIVSPNGQEQLVPVQIFRCDDCGNIPAMFLPNVKK
jgi:hypothetical protein